MEFELPQFTSQTRLHLTEEQEAVLDMCANHLSGVERVLFSEMMAGKDPTELKSPYLIHFGITARHFNACHFQVKGKIDSIKELRKRQIEELKERIATLEKKIKKLINPHTLHQKKRRLSHLKNKLNKLITDQNNGKIPLCFGTKKLFKAQFALKANGFSSHQEWQATWQQKRNSSFFLLGSKDEIAGNQTCTATLVDDTLTLRLRLPDFHHEKYLEITGLKFKYGFENILAALEQCQQRNTLSKAKDPHYKNHGQAISYRFQKDKKGWLLFISTTKAEPKWTTRDQIGLIGIDINADHLAVVETDHYGNPIKNKTIPLNTYGKSTDQAKALIGDIAKELIQWSLTTQKPLVLEKLDFQKKKSTLRESTPRYARMLSSLAYTATIQAIKSRAYRHGVKVKEVNPAYTSIIGRAKFKDRYGLTIHESAALTIARRSQGFSERLPRQLKIPDGKCGHVALPLPVRNRGEHVWKQWRQVSKKLLVVLAAHFRAPRSSSRKKAACCDGHGPPESCWRNSNTRTANNTA